MVQFDSQVEIDDVLAMVFIINEKFVKNKIVVELL